MAVRSKRAAIVLEAATSVASTSTSTSTSNSKVTFLEQLRSLLAPNTQSGKLKDAENADMSDPVAVIGASGRL